MKRNFICVLGLVLLFLFLFVGAPGDLNAQNLRTPSPTAIRTSELLLRVTIELVDEESPHLPLEGMRIWIKKRSEMWEGNLFRGYVWRTVASGETDSDGQITVRLSRNYREGDHLNYDYTCVINPTDPGNINDPGAGGLPYPRNSLSFWRTSGRTFLLDGHHSPWRGPHVYNIDPQETEGAL